MKKQPTTKNPRMMAKPQTQEVPSNLQTPQETQDGTATIVPTPDAPSLETPAFGSLPKLSDRPLKVPNQKGYVPSPPGSQNNHDSK